MDCAESWLLYNFGPRILDKHQPSPHGLRKEIEEEEVSIWEDLGWEHDPILPYNPAIANPPYNPAIANPAAPAG